jgi:hypothetical protein
MSTDSIGVFHPHQDSRRPVSWQKLPSQDVCVGYKCKVTGDEIKFTRTLGESAFIGVHPRLRTIQPPVSP